MYYTPDYNNLQDKEKVVNKLSHLSGALSDPSSSLIKFYGSDTSKVGPGGGGVRASLVSTSDLCLSPVQNAPLQKREVEDADGQGKRKG